MEALRNILVLMEPGSESQPAFDAALLLARRFGARLELLMTDYQDLHAAYFQPPTATVQQFHDSVMAAHRAVLERYEQLAAAVGVPLMWPVAVFTTTPPTCPPPATIAACDAEVLLPTAILVLFCTVEVFVTVPRIRLFSIRTAP